MSAAAAPATPVPTKRERKLATHYSHSLKHLMIKLKSGAVLSASARHALHTLLDQLTGRLGNEALGVAMGSQRTGLSANDCVVAAKFILPPGLHAKAVDKFNIASRRTRKERKRRAEAALAAAAVPGVASV